MSIRNALRIAALLLLAASLDQTSYAQQTGWVYLGEANVDGNADRDRITVGRSDGRFSALQIRVERAPIEFQRVVVHYGNGQSEDLEIRDRIRAGGRTRNIDIRGQERVIESVELWYARANYGSRKPRLRLYGLMGAPNQSGPAPQTGWVYLGEANVDGNADHDRITVGRSEGRFRALQISVENAPIEFRRVVVHYGNGQNEDLEIRDRIRAGGRTRNIDIRGQERTIESVELWYARANYGSRRPKLRLYGR